MNIERLAQHLESETAAGRFSGAVLVSRNDAAVFEAAYGLANRADSVLNTSRTRFGVASVGKAFTAVAIARLVERGALKFSSRVVDVLPVPLRPQMLSQSMTLHHLLTHTSGLPDYFDEEHLGAAAYSQIWERLPSYRVRRPADFLPLFATLTPPVEPGGEFSYCNAGYILLGLVLEVVTGQPYAAVIQQEVFEPAGMADAGFFPMDEPHPRIAVGYIPPTAEGQPWTSNVFSIPPIGAPDGGAYGTARDVDRFLAALAAGQLLRPDMAATLITPHVALPEGEGYGYGVWVLQGQAPLRIGLLGEDPGFSARAYIYPEMGIRATILSNMSEGAGPTGRPLSSLLGIEDSPG